VQFVWLGEVASAGSQAIIYNFFFFGRFLSFMVGSACKDELKPCEILFLFTHWRYQKIRQRWKREIGFQGSHRRGIQHGIALLKLCSEIKP
jgi:hypothetical protein